LGHRFHLNEEIVMPVVRVSFYEGRSREQKREIAEVITDALVRIAGSRREAVNVLFDGHAKEDWVIGGAPEYSRSDK
jgi:4-oxalocrotonate tautomerase